MKLFTFRRILQNWDSKLSDLAFTSCCCSSNLKLELLWSGGERELQLWQCLPIVKVKVNFIFRLNRMEKPKGESTLSFKLGITLCTSPLLRMIKVTNTRQTNKPPTCLQIWKTWSSNLPVFIPGTFLGPWFSFFLNLYSSSEVSKAPHFPIRFVLNSENLILCPNLPEDHRVWLIQYFSFIVLLTIISIRLNWSDWIYESSLYQTYSKVSSKNPETVIHSAL